MLVQLTQTIPMNATFWVKFCNHFTDFIWSLLIPLCSLVYMDCAFSDPTWWVFFSSSSRILISFSYFSSVYWLMSIAVFFFFFPDYTHRNNVFGNICITWICEWSLSVILDPLHTYICTRSFYLRHTCIVIFAVSLSGFSS